MAGISAGPPRGADAVLRPFVAEFGGSSRVPGLIVGVPVPGVGEGSPSGRHLWRRSGAERASRGHPYRPRRGAERPISCMLRAAGACQAEWVRQTSLGVHVTKEEPIRVRGNVISVLGTAPKRVRANTGIRSILRQCRASLPSYGAHLDRLQTSTQLVIVKPTTTLAMVILALISVAAPPATAEQKLLFCADSVSTSRGTIPYSCMLDCKKYSDDKCLQNELDSGWQITSTVQKSVPESIGCQCVGTSYVLTKDNAKTGPAASKEDYATLARELESLRKEIDSLKSEIDSLKKKASQKK